MMSRVCLTPTHLGDVAMVALHLFGHLGRLNEVRWNQPRRVTLAMGGAMCDRGQRRRQLRTAKQDECVPRAGNMIARLLPRMRLSSDSLVLAG